MKKYFLSESQIINDFIAINYLDISDEVIGKRFGLSKDAIRWRRRRMGLKRPHSGGIISDDDKKLISDVIIFFSDNNTVAHIARQLDISHSRATNILHNHYFTKQRSYNTETLVVASKIK